MNIDEILNNVDFDELLQDLKPEDLGFFYRLNCPKCGERQAIVYKDDKDIVCSNNSCNLKKSIFDYIKDKYNYTQKEALEYFKTFAGNISYNDKRRSVMNKSLEQIQTANMELNKELVNNLTTNRNHKIWDFIRSRNYIDQDVEAMGIGLDLRTTYSLSIPFYHPEEDIILGFYRRDITGEQTKKYKVSPELPVGKFFFNANRIIDFLDELIIVEGVLDALLMTARGINNVVAIAGSIITENQKKHLSSLIQKGISKIYLFLDNDSEGIDSTVKSISLVKEIGGLPIVIRYVGRDPGEFLANPENDFNKAKLNAIDGDDWLSELQKDDHGDTAEVPVLKEPTYYGIDNFLEEIGNLSEGLGTGFPMLDNSIIMPPGELSLLASPAGHGKTSFLYNLLLNQLEIYRDRSFCFFTSESNRLSLIVSLINIIAGIAVDGPTNSNKENIRDYLKGNSEKTANPAIEKALGKIRSYLDNKRIFIIDEKLSSEELKRRIIELKKNNQSLTALYIDSFSLLKSSGSISADRHLQLKNMILDILDTANRANVAVIASVQRINDPNASAIVDYQYLKQYASIVLSLKNKYYDPSLRDDKTRGDGQKQQIELVVVKNRDNMPGQKIHYALIGNTHYIRENESGKTD